MLKKIIVVALLFALSGCGTVLHPGTGMKIPTSQIGSFSGPHSVKLINDQPNKTPLNFFRWFTTDLNEWTQFLIDELSEELTKRDVVVLASSPNKLNVKIVEMTSAESFSAIRMFLTVLLSTPDNSWSKEIMVNESSAWTAGRALGGAIYRANEKILKDKEIMNKMRL